MRIRVIPIVPRKIADWLREDSVLLVGALYGLGEAVDDIEVGAAVGDRLDRLVAPLRPAPTVDDTAFFLDTGSGG